MECLAVTITRVVADDFPGWVECILIDANGREHEFIEKEPIVSRQILTRDTTFPQPGFIACIVREELAEKLGRTLVSVDTIEPWGVESVAGETNFIVFRESLVHS